MCAKELFDLYDINRRPLGKTIERGAKLPPNVYRLVVHVCIFSTDGKMLCQRRQTFKKSWSNMWDVSVGGAVDAGETSEQGARRETQEELGLQLPQKLLPSLTINFDEGFDDWYCVTANVDESKCRLQQEEVAEVQWLTSEEILQKISDGSFIPYEESLIKLVFALRNHQGSHTRKDTSISTQKANHQMNLDKAPYEKIISGQKTVEMRLNDEKRQNFAVGDLITLVCCENKIVAKIIDIRKYANFAALYAAEDLTKCGYTAEEVQNASPEDMLAYYSAEKQAKYGALAIEIEVLATL